LKERFGDRLALVVVLLYPSLGGGCFWHERRHDRDIYVERRHVDHEEHEHERREDRHEDRREHER
jgi:hypothetical protein